MTLSLDKQLHFCGGLIISLALGIFSPLAGFIAAALIGALKELVWDWRLGKGTPELADLLATALGGAVGAVYLLAAGVS